MRILSSVGLLLVMSAPVLCVDVTHASESLDVRFSGFGSLGIGRVSDEDLRFLDYRHESWSSESDSVFGLQVNAVHESGVSLTGQAVARGFQFETPGEHYEPSVEWLFAAWQMTDDMRMRAGRLRTPLYMYSESLEAGYSYPWVRPPVDMYAIYLSPLSNFDGVDISRFLEVGGYLVQLKAVYGRSDSGYLDYEAKLEPLIGGSIEVDDGDINRWRFSYIRMDTNLFNTAARPALNLYRGLLASVDPVFPAIAETLGDENVGFDYFSAGWARDDGTWAQTIEAFYTPSPGEQFSFSARGGYASIVRQYETFSPYFVVGYYDSYIDRDVTNRVRRSLALIPASSPLFGLNQILGNAILAGFDALNYCQSSVAVGVRHEFMPGVAMKLEVQAFEFHKETAGQFTWLGDPDQKPESAQVVSAVVDVVF